ncbi:MAG: hypothetical protein K2K06_10485 [Oscillospiraceae bacterium]|nr:hypothetical protein [Oscillospiraceae bacterium]
MQSRTSAPLSATNQIISSDFSVGGSASGLLAVINNAKPDAQPHQILACLNQTCCHFWK